MRWIRVCLVSLLACGFVALSQAQTGSLWLDEEVHRPAWLPEHSTQVLSLNESTLRQTMKDAPRRLVMDWPIVPPGEDQAISLEGTRVDFAPSAIPVTLHGGQGEATWTSVTTEFVAYRVEDDRWSGFVVLEDRGVMAVLKNGSLTLEVAHHHDNVHVVHHVEQATRPEPFSCGVEFMGALDRTQRPTQGLMVARSDTLCIEFALDIDHITYESFDTYEDAVQWAVIYLLGASEVFVEELQGVVKFIPIHVNVWVEPDPWANVAFAPGEMLDELTNAWNQDPVLSAVDRDLVHLFTIRNDTGVGGIAWLGTMCGGLGVAYSNSLSSTAIDYPNTTWGLGTICHEIGHNFGSRHTHWCDWPGSPDHPNGMAGGTIDNCVAADGDCVNVIQWQQGTIMSYCGGLSFHPVVEEFALLPAVANASCLETCEDFVSPLDFLGCTDEEACNYDEEATLMDGSCEYPEATYLDCEGQCLTDEDADGECDEVDECVGPCIVPNVFSPNGRQGNERFPIRDLDGYPGSVLRIFNRYGNEVWQGTSGPNDDRIVWDGNDNNGDPCAVGFYVWVLHRSDGEKLHGPISLFR